MNSNSICLSIVVLVAVLASPCGAASNEDFADYKVESLGETGILFCNDTDSRQALDIPELFTPVAWILPNLTVINSDGDRFDMQDENYTLVINSTTLNDLGVYHCMFQDPNNTDNYYLVKVGLNAEGPYFFDMWEKYMWPTIISICALFGFLLLAAICILLYVYHYVPPEKRGGGGGSDASSDSSSGHGDGKHEGTPHNHFEEHHDRGDKLVNSKEHHAYENPSYHDGEGGKGHHHTEGTDPHEAKQKGAHNEYEDVRGHHTEEHDSSDEEATTF